MVIIYKDDLGFIAQITDVEITFYDGMAYFESDGNDYKIKVENIVKITNNTQIY